jgi:hypothetical protein
VEGAVSIEVAANGIRVKGNEYDVVKFRCDQLEASIISASTHRFMLN